MTDICPLEFRLKTQTLSGQRRMQKVGSWRKAGEFESTTETHPATAMIYIISQVWLLVLTLCSSIHTHAGHLTAEKMYITASTYAVHN
jgi:hypothetical protein